MNSLFHLSLMTAEEHGFIKTYEGQYGIDFQKDKISLSIERLEDEAVFVKGRKRPRYFGSRIQSIEELKEFFAGL
jgi:hypothetical protein